MELSTNIIYTTIRGDKEDGIPNQDYVQIFENENLLIIAMSDGLGSSKNSLGGAMLACKIVIEEVQQIKIDDEIKIIGARIKEHWEHTVIENGGNIKDYRTTNSFITVFKNEKKILIGQLGDVLVSIRIDGLFRHLESSNKDFLNETNCLGSGRDDEYKIVLFEFGHSYDFILATDGIGDEIQADKVEVLHDYFKNKFQQIDTNLRNEVLKSEIEEFLQEKNNDDKTIVFTWTNRI